MYGHIASGVCQASGALLELPEGLASAERCQHLAFAGTLVEPEVRTLCTQRQLSPLC